MKIGILLKQELAQVCSDCSYSNFHTPIQFFTLLFSFSHSCSNFHTPVQFSHSYSIFHTPIQFFTLLFNLSHSYSNSHSHSFKILLYFSIFHTLIQTLKFFTLLFNILRTILSEVVPSLVCIDFGSDHLLYLPMLWKNLAARS